MLAHIFTGSPELSLIIWQYAGSYICLLPYERLVLLRAFTLAQACLGIHCKILSSKDSGLSSNMRRLLLAFVARQYFKLEYRYERYLGYAHLIFIQKSPAHNNAQAYPNVPPTLLEKVKKK